MVLYLAKRMAVSVLIVYGVITLTVFLIRLIPGHAVDYLYNRLLQQGGLTPQQTQQQVSAMYGLTPKVPLWQQYLRATVITGAIPWTVFIVSVSVLGSFGIGLIVGTVMATVRHRRGSTAVLLVSSFLNAVPNYLFAILLLYFLADLRHAFPFVGGYSRGIIVWFNGPFIANIFRHTALPIGALVVTAFGGWTLMMQSSVIGTLGRDYVRYSYAEERCRVSSPPLSEVAPGRRVACFLPEPVPEPTGRRASHHSASGTAVVAGGFGTGDPGIAVSSRPAEPGVDSWR